MKIITKPSRGIIPPSPAEGGKGCVLIKQPTSTIGLQPPPLRGSRRRFFARRWGVSSELPQSSKYAANCSYLARGVKSRVFRTQSGKIIRAKPLWFGTYAREKKIADFLIANGGLGVRVPNLTVSKKGLRAFSVHDEIKGSPITPDAFMKWPAAGRKKFAEQLADALLRMYRINGGKKSGKIFPAHKTGWLRCARIYFSLRKYIHKKGMSKKYMKICRAERAPTNVGLIHGDLHLRNIIADKNFNLRGIIDLDGVKIGPFEHNLRKLPMPLIKLMTAYLKTKKINLNQDTLAFHRIVFLLKKLKKYPSPATLSELSEMF